MSEGVTYCVPATHWKFEIVGLGGMSACGLNSLSSDLGLHRQSVSHIIFSVFDKLTTIGPYPTY
jgi:hypothetical protein